MDLANEDFNIVVETVTVKRYHIVHGPKGQAINKVKELSKESEYISSIDDELGIDYSVEELPDGWDSDPVYQKPAKWIMNWINQDRTEEEKPKKRRRRKKRVDKPADTAKIETDDLDSLLDDIL